MHQHPQQLKKYIKLTTSQKEGFFTSLCSIFSLANATRIPKKKKICQLQPEMF
jgi:hypothetical protein